MIYNAGLVGIRCVVTLTNDLSDFGGKPCAWVVTCAHTNGYVCSNCSALGI